MKMQRLHLFDVTKDLNDLGIITLNKSADELADETFVNVGQVK